jgi:histone H3/H4
MSALLELKKPRSSYFIFAAEVREVVKAENPGVGVAQQAKLIGERWASLTKEEKKEYEGLHDAEKAAYEAALAARPEPAVGAGGEGEEEEEEEGGSSLPLSRVKRIIKLDPDISRVTGDAAFLIATATELFLSLLTREASAVAVAAGRKTLTDLDFARAAAGHPALTFLTHDLRVPSAADEEAVKAARVAARKAAKEAAAAGAAAAAAAVAAPEGEEGGEGEWADGAEPPPAPPAPRPLAPTLDTLFARLIAAGPAPPSRRMLLATPAGEGGAGVEDGDEVMEVNGEVFKPKAAPAAPKQAGKGKGKAEAPLLDRFFNRVDSAQAAAESLARSIAAAHGDEPVPVAPKGGAGRGKGKAQGKRVSFGAGAGAGEDDDGFDREEEVEDEEMGAAVAQGEVDEFDIGFIRRTVAGKGRKKAARK